LILAGNGSVKESETCLPGELIRCDPNSGGGLLAIVLRAGEAQVSLLILESSNADLAAFSVLPFPGGFRCFSYGTDWVLELQPDIETWPGNRDGSDIFGEVRLHTLAATMIVNLLDERLQGQPALMDLSEFRIVTRQRHSGARVQSWRIWASQDEQHRPNGKHIFAFPPQR
jgi:hypothetical protein